MVCHCIVVEMSPIRSATFLAIAVLSGCIFLFTVYVLTSGVNQPRPYPAGHGYILELSSSDQLTSGAANVLCLQCLARQIHPRVVLVEPFVTVRSQYGASLVGDQELFARENNVKLSDIFDISVWKRITQQQQYAPLVTWEYFLKYAPRDVILVQNLFDKECSALVHLNETLSPFFKVFQFQVVRLACLQPKTSGPLTLNQFKVAVYGNYSPPTVTVIFDRFCGIGTGIWPYATAITETACEKRTTQRFFHSLKPSSRVLKDAATFAKRYLGGANNYTSVMIRTAHSVLTLGYSNGTRVLSKCLRKAVEEWKAMKSRVGSNNTYLTHDNFFRNNVGASLIKNFTQELYGNDNDQWESRFEDVAGLNHTGGVVAYVAIVQKVVVAQARCIILIGGGSFQGSAFRMYTESHKLDSRCYKRWDKYCT